MENAYHLHAYPNPFSDNVLVEITTEQAGKLRLIDMLGRVVQEVAVFDGEQSLKLDGSSLIPGIYSCQLLINGKIVVHELMVKN